MFLNIFTMRYLCVCACVCVCVCGGVFSCRGVSDQWEVLAHLPSLLLEDLLSYSKSLSSFYHLNHTYTLVTTPTHW